ncbi:MAG: hypothetical protein J5878_01905 [Oscillospiraceae bacterium]|nr:hypothetical protein [Oscillospiraceae bacterium]
MKRKLLGLAAIALVLALGFWVWGKNTGGSGENSLEITGRDYGILVYLDGKLLSYADLEQDETTVRLVKTDAETGAETEMGTMPAVGMSYDDGDVFAGKYYQCFSNGGVVGSGDESRMVGVLYEFDPKQSVAVPVADTRKEDIGPTMWLCAVSNGILQLKAPRVDSGEHAYFDLYCPDTGKNETVLTGSDVDEFCQSAVDQNLLYVLTSHHNDPNRSSMFSLQVFETEGYRMVSEINLDALESMLREARVGDMVVCGDYVYFSNWNNHSVIAKISDGVATPVLERELPMLRCAEWFNRPEQTKQMLFYEQLEENPECVVLNADTGELRSFRPKLRKGYELHWIQIDGERLMVYSAKESLFTGKDYYKFLDFYDFDDFIRQDDGDGD